MIGYFPTLYSDEVLYSWFARYHKHSGNLSIKHTIIELFNKSSAVAVMDIPSNLNDVHAALSHFHIPEIDYLITNHSLYNYYTYFQSELIRDKVMKYILFGDKPGSVHLLLGINSFKVKEWGFFRFCCQCFAEDIEKYGEPYWHLSHQLPKSLYCTKHNLRLRNSQVKIRNKEKQKFISAADSITILDNNDELPTYNLKTENHLKMVSNENEKLLYRKYDNLSSKVFGIYKYLLQDKGYANYGGKINQVKLASDFVNFYGEEFLDIVDSNIKIKSQTCWLKTITRKTRKAFHPIHHILLMNFLGYSIDTINNVSGKNYQPFGEGPYYCLNPGAQHYKKRVIKTVRISNCSESRKPIGTFECNCGFIYIRKGPDKVTEDKFRIDKVKKYGDVWIDKVIELSQKGFSLRKIAHLMSCDPGTVKKYKAQLVIGNNSCRMNELIDTDEIRSQKEDEWSSLQQKNPLYNITTLRRMNPSLYIWHYRNNKDFLLRNRVDPKVDVGLEKRVDWEKRDIDTLCEVSKVVNDLYQSDIPTYVNIASVTKRISHPSYLDKYLDKLPRTKKYLNDRIESREEFQIRRLYWSYKKLHDNGEVIKEWKLRKIVGFKRKMSDNIECIVKEILNGIK